VIEFEREISATDRRSVVLSVDSIASVEIV
jgi:hypothetical protein